MVGDLTRVLQDAGPFFITVTIDRIYFIASM